MRSFKNAITAVNAVRQDRVNVAGMVELREAGPQRPHLYGYGATRAGLTLLSGTWSRTSGKPGCSPERHPAHGWRERQCSTRPCAHGRSARLGAARIS